MIENLHLHSPECSSSIVEENLLIPESPIGHYFQFQSGFLYMGAFFIKYYYIFMIRITKSCVLIKYLQPEFDSFLPFFSVY